MLTHTRTLRALKRACFFSSGALRGDTLKRQDLPLRRHAIYFDSFIGPNLPAARGLLATLRDGIDKCVDKRQSKLLWIERARETESSAKSIDDIEEFYANAKGRADSWVGTKQYISMMKGGTRSINTFSWFDALKVQESLRRNARTDVLVSLTILDANASNDQCFEFWSRKGEAGHIEALNRIYLEIESRAFQSAPVWIFANQSTWKYYEQRHASLKVWAKDKRVYFYPRRNYLQHDTVAFYHSYVRLVDRIWKDYPHADSLGGLS